MAIDGYNGNPNLKKTGVATEWTPERMEEFVKCANDPIYFAEQYIKIVHVDHGFIPIRLYDYQKEIVEATTNHRNVAVLTGRQQGKCVHGDTKIKVRNDATGEIREVGIGELFEEASRF